MPEVSIPGTIMITKSLKMVTYWNAGAHLTFIISFNLNSLTLYSEVGTTGVPVSWLRTVNEGRPCNWHADILGIVSFQVYRKVVLYI